MTEAMSAAPASPSPFAGSEWFDPLEEAVRLQVRGFIEELLQEELEAALGRGRYERGEAAKGHRHGRRPRQLVTTFGPLELSVPRARLHDGADEREWKSALLPAYKRLSHRAEALIAQAYLAGMNTRRVRRALGSLFAGKVGKDMVSRAWQRTRSAWEAWHKRDLAGEGIVRLILDGTVVKVRLDKRATAISLLIALGIRRDGQKVVLAIKNLGGESEAAWRAVLDDLVVRGPQMPSSGCTRSSSGGSRRNACCPAPRPPSCCSGRFWPRVRSPYARSTAGKALPSHRSCLTSPPEQTNHGQQEPRRSIPTNPATRPRLTRGLGLPGKGRSPAGRRHQLSPMPSAMPDTREETGIYTFSC